MWRQKLLGALLHCVSAPGFESMAFELPADYWPKASAPAAAPAKL